MYFRVVMQGRTLGGADLDEVKQHFVRVTGLPANVAEQMFGGMPQVIKRQVAQSDAERIAATLRAIGAAATVEREAPGTKDETDEGIAVLATPLHSGPPTIAPGAMPAPETTPAPSRHAHLLRRWRNRWPLLAAVPVLIAAAIFLAPFAEDFLADARPAPEPSRVVPARAPAAATAQPAATLNPKLLQGPWRCTDQNTGVSTYWSYALDGALTFHGDVLTDGPTPRGLAAAAPTGWTLDGRQLFHTYGGRAPDSYAIGQLTLMRLRYGNERDVEVECRRP
jgi:hypothetical protein